MGHGRPAEPLDIGKERAVETLKSLVQISVEGLKLLALLNGGAVVALLAYLGNIAGKSVAPNMRLPIVLFVVGLCLDGFAFAGSYLTQLWLYNERGSHRYFLWSTFALAILSLGFFGAGAYAAAVRFPSVAPNESVSTGAWVLWTSADAPTYSSGFGVVTAYPSLQQCDAALLDEASRLTLEGFTVSSPKDHVIMAFKGKGANIAATRYSCLPDTVDPRGPEGTK